MKNLKQAVSLLLISGLIISGCGGQSSAVTQDPVTSEEQAVLTEENTPTSSYKKPESSEPEAVYQAPPLHEVTFNEAASEGNEQVRLDFSESSYGYFGVQAKSDEKVKVRVVKGDMTYIYNVSSDGTTAYLSFQSGDGDYEIAVLENVVDSKYAVIYSTVTAVTLNNEFEPFLRSNDYVPFTAASDCVTKAAELAAQASDDVGVVKAVFDYICANITYDDDKAAEIQFLEAPNPDETLKSGKGICFDYASLAASMLRSQGIPTKVIFGYVSPNNIYHAWNMFYTEQTGWVTVSYQVTKDEWNRLDPTFSANGADDTFIGDGTNYSDVYYY